MRLFFHLSGYVFGPALVVSAVCLWRGETECAGVAAGVAAAAFVYWMAFYTRRDLR